MDMTDTPGAGPIRVFLLDDHEVVRRGLKDLLEADGDIVVVGESGLAQEAIRRIPALRPNVAVLDGRLPDGSGIDVCRDIRSSHPEIAALILTSYDDDEALFAAIMAGAAGYVLKQIRGNDLVDAVRRVAAGQSLLDPAVTAQVLDRLRQGPPQDYALDPLTDQERRILELIGEGLTNRQIGERMFLAEKTVKNYVSSLLSKLGHGAPHPGRRVRHQAPAPEVAAAPMRLVTDSQLAAVLAALALGPRVVASGNGASPRALLRVLDRHVPAYGLFVLNAHRGLPSRPEVVHETPFVGPGMRHSPTLSYVPARLSQVPRLFATTMPPDVVAVTVAPARDGKLSLGTEVNVLPAAIEACRARGGIVIAQVNHGMPWTYGDGVLDPMTSTTRSRRTSRSTSQPCRARRRARRIGELVAARIGTAQRCSWASGRSRTRRSRVCRAGAVWPCGRRCSPTASWRWTRSARSTRSAC